MAPEQASSQAVDARCDLFSVGCVLYHACTGKPPFTGRDTVSTLMAVATEQPPAPRERNPEVTPALNDLIVRLLAKSPAGRPQSAREVVQALEAIERAAPPAGITATKSGGLFGHRRRWLAAVTAGLLVAVALAAVILLQIKDDKGEGIVRIETVDPDVEVVVKSGGREFTIYDKKSRQEVTLPVGRYEVELKGGKDGLKLETDQFTLKRGDRAVVQVTWSPGKGRGAGTESVRGPRPAPLDCTGPEGVSALEVRRAQAAWAKYLGRPVEETVEVADGVKMTFVLIPPGKFHMGSPSEELEYVTKTFFAKTFIEGRRPDWLDNETLHEVTVTAPFDLAQTEVTQAQYKALTGVNPSAFKGGERPVEMVSWTEARGWTEKLTTKRRDKHLYRLPTEAEWEYSCRGGRFSTKPFGVGDGRSLSSREANFDGRFPYGGADKGEQSKGPCAVASYPANAFGLYDMHGNVFEWCQDWYGPYPRGAVTNPAGPEKGLFRVLRGGCFFHDAANCRASYRPNYEPSNRYNDLGFRVARSVPSGVE
jgi:formylglycine-generating enzyme required for sulfatase activity